MKKLKLILLLLLISAMTFALSSCADTFDSYLAMIGLGNTHTCADANGDTLCDTCSKYVAPAQCTAHVDNNNDGFCDNTGCNATVLMEMTGIVFNNRSFTYDGTAKTIEVKGAPQGATIEYDIENTQTNAGNYKITAYITADGYADYEVSATLRIKEN